MHLCPCIVEIWYVHVWGVSDAGPIHIVVISQSDLSNQTGNPPAHPSIKLNYVECIQPHKVHLQPIPPPTATDPTNHQGTHHRDEPVFRSWRLQQP